MKTEYTIDRSKWVCFSKRYKLGESAMLNDIGRMCCLGHICNQAGVSKKRLAGVGNPEGVGYKDPKHIPKWLYDKDSPHKLQTATANEMIGVNDSHEYTPKQRETALIKIAKTAGITLKFVGRLRDGKMVK